jgi:hypothetical protein
MSISNVVPAVFMDVKQSATVFHLPASLSAFQLSPSALVKIAVFIDGQAMSPGCHKPEPQDFF